METQKKKDCFLCKLFKAVFIYTFGVLTGIIATILFL